MSKYVVKAGKYKVFPIVIVSIILAFWFTTIFWSFNKELLPFKVIYFLLLGMIALLLLFCILIPSDVIIVDPKEKKVYINGGEKLLKSYKKYVLDFNKIISISLEIGDYYEYILIKTTKESYSIKRVKDKEKAVNVMNSLVFNPEEGNKNAEISNLLWNDDISKLYDYEGQTFIMYLYVYLKDIVYYNELDDEILDIYIYLEFVNNLCRGNIFDFINVHRKYIDRLINFMDKLNIGWTKVNFQEMLQNFPNLKDDNYYQNIKNIFDNSDKYASFVEEITMINEKMLKEHFDNNVLLYNALEKYVKDNKIDFSFKEEEHEDNQ